MGLISQVWIGGGGGGGPKLRLGFIAIRGKFWQKPGVGRKLEYAVFFETDY